MQKNMSNLIGEPVQCALEQDLMDGEDDHDWVCTFHYTFILFE